MDNITIRSYNAVEAGDASYPQASFPKRDHGPNDIFERHLLSSIARFVDSPAGSRLWVAMDGHRIIGSIAIVKAKVGAAVRLRWFIIDERYQEKGIAERLLDVSMQFCRKQRHNHIYLWTTRILDDARHLYERYGFRQTGKIPNKKWIGESIIEERWDLWL